MLLCQLYWWNNRGWKPISFQLCIQDFCCAERKRDSHLLARYRWRWNSEYSDDRRETGWFGDQQHGYERRSVGHKHYELITFAGRGVLLRVVRNENKHSCLSG
jgi:hypothetical protein